MIRRGGGVVPVLPPTLASLDVSSGTEAGGTTITATGSNFYGLTGVTVNGVAAPSVTYISQTSATFVMPAATFAISSTAADNAKDVVLTNPAGSSTLTGGYTYTSEFKRLAGALYLSEWRANDSRISLSTTKVVSWPDYAGLNPLAQGTDANRPTYEATGWNSGPGIYSDGSNRSLAVTLASALASGTRPYLAFAVERASGAGVYFLCPPADINRFAMAWVGSNFVLFDNNSGDGTGPALDTNKHFMQWGMLSSATNKLRVDGTGYNGTLSAALNANVTDLRLFANGVVARIPFMVLLSGEPSAQLITDLRTTAKSAMWIGYTGSSLNLP